MTLKSRIKVALRILLKGLPKIKRAEFSFESRVKLEEEGRWKFVSTTMFADVLGDWHLEKTKLIYEDTNEQKTEMLCGRLHDLSVMSDEDVILKMELGEPVEDTEENSH